MILVTSWDDGHPLDERIADMLSRFGLSGTFYVPVRNREGYPVMDSAALRRIAQSFEIGGHTLDHAYLTAIPPSEVDYQVRAGKDGIEQQLGCTIEGFCYPGGKENVSIRNTVRQIGFRYARTMENLRVESQDDLYRLPTTLQFFPHPTQVLLRNFLRYGRWARRTPVLLRALGACNWWERFPAIAETFAQTDNVLHLWGHSWEIEKFNLWKQLEQVLADISLLRPHSLTVAQSLAESLGRSK